MKQPVSSSGRKVFGGCCSCSGRQKTWGNGDIGTAALQCEFARASERKILKITSYTIEDTLVKL